MTEIRIRQIGRMVALIVACAFTVFAITEIFIPLWWWFFADAVVAAVFFVVAYRLKRRVEELKERDVERSRHPLTPLPPTR